MNSVSGISSLTVAGLNSEFIFACQIILSPHSMVARQSVFLASWFGIFITVESVQFARGVVNLKTPGP